MNAPLLAEPNAPVLAPAWRAAILPLGLGLLLLGAIFPQEIAAALHTWNASTAYNHCFLVIPIVAYLFWDRRDDLAGFRPRPFAAAALLGLPVGLIWLLAERLGIMEGRQLAMVSFVEVLCLAVLGRRLWWAMSGPLLYLFFLVPFGEFLTPKLQDVTTFFIRHGLGLLHVPAYIDGYTIEIPQGTFFVAEACAGLRFLIASIAFGCLYALLMYRDTLRRFLFILVSLVVPVFANGLRALGIVYLGYVLDSTQAAAADHIIYGWVFFSAVILLLIALGLPFRQDHLPARRGERLASPASQSPRAQSPPGQSPSGQFSPGQPPLGQASLGQVPLGQVPLGQAPLGQVPHGEPSPGQRPRSQRLVAPALAVALIAVLAPAVAAALSASARRVAPTPAVIDIGSGCVVRPGSSIGAVRTERVTCGEGAPMDLAWQTFSTRSTAAPVMAARRQLTSRAQTESLSEHWLPATAGPSPWRIMASADPVYFTAVAVWIDGKPVRPGLGMRARMALDSLLGSAHPPMVVTLTPVVAWETVTPDRRARLAADLQSFLAVHAALADRIGALSERN